MTREKALCDLSRAAMACYIAGRCTGVDMDTSINVRDGSDTDHYKSVNFWPYGGEVFVRAYIHPRLSDEVRMSVAEAYDMLHSSELSIKEISARTGCASANYFGKVFWRTFGKTPSEMRRAGLTDLQE